MMSAVVSNPGHPEYGVATIPFPIPRDQYTYCMDLLEALEIGDTVKADCKVVAFDSAYNVLKRMEQCTVNVEELNYLAKRLDSFDTGEAAQFQAMAHKLELFELKDLINLTFCCQQATVIAFADSRASMISVVFHDKFSDEDNTLFIGHVGVLLPAEDGSLYFIEKVAFQEPYRLVKLQNRTELSDYLMEKCDTSWGQDTTRPFIMENDTLMDGYRPNPLEETSP